MLSLIALAGSVAAVNVSHSIEVVSAYTTFLPSATSFVEGTSTYVVTAPTTLTVSNCPCTRTHTYSIKSVTVCPKGKPSGPKHKDSASSVRLSNGGNKNGLPLIGALGAFAVANLL